jgi:hypothetical protein
MKTRLTVACVLIVMTLCGCVTDQPRPSGSLGDGTYHLEIGKPLPSQLSAPNCPVQ